jgi:hypothetical protein
MSLRTAKTLAKGLLHKLFVATQRLGISVLPMHFYSSIPNIRDLRRRSDWRAPRSMHGISVLSESDQIAWLRELLVALPAGYAAHAAAVRRHGGDGYGEIEADVLAAFVAYHRPRRIVQIGCGVSTAVMLDAAGLAGYRPTITCIDPYPTAFLERCAAEDGSIQLIAQNAQDVPMHTLVDLDGGDLLFVDSTHTVKPGSEVNRIILEVMPRLASGVFVHFHDIYFPYDYPRDLLSGDLFFPNESVLLYAFLLNNPLYRIELCMSMLHYSMPDALKGLVPRYDAQANQLGLRASGGKHFPSSLYLRRV